MNHKMKNIISVIISLCRLSIIKLFNWNKLNFHFIERLSPNVEIFIGKKATLKLGKRVRAHTNAKIRVRNNAELSIGDNTALNYGCIITSRKKIHIGAGVEIGPNVLIYDHDHDFRTEGGIKAKLYRYGDVIVEDNVWIGANTVILRGTRIGANSIVGAGTILNGEYPENSIIIQKRETIVKEY